MILRVLPRGRLEIHDHQPARGVALEQIERADQRAVEHLAGVQVDQRHVERLLDPHDLRLGLPLAIEHREHPAGEVEQARLRVPLAEADRLLVRLEVPVALEIALHLVERGGVPAATPPNRNAAAPWMPGAERQRRRDEVGRHAVHRA